jgi:RNA polymerase subunit RPABC4/transcription elongation factor Spt4
MSDPILITCPACKSEVSSQAQSCPKCGQPIAGTNYYAPPPQSPLENVIRDSSDDAAQQAYEPLSTQWSSASVETEPLVNRQTFLNKITEGFSRGQITILAVEAVLGVCGILGGLLQLSEGRAEGLISLAVWPAIVGITWLVMRRNNQRRKDVKDSGVVDKFLVGNYLIGLPRVNQRIPAVTCAIFENDFVFMDGNRSVDSIPRDAVNQILVDSKSQITQRLTATRMLAMGVFALAAPKKQRHQEFCLVIDWEDDKGMVHNTIFDFLGANGNALANYAANGLRHYVKPKAQRVKAGEKKCPQCAEVIRAEAKICKYCHSPV